MFNRFFRRKPQPADQQPTPVDYAALFDQVIEGLATGWSAAQVQAGLAGRENDDAFLQWLYRYDQDVLQVNPDPAVVERLIAWGTMDCGAVGKFVSEMGQRAAKMSPPASESIPQPVDEYLQQGNEAYGQGDFLAAIAAYEQVLAIAPHHQAALSNQGASLAGLGRFEDAIATYDLALVHAPKALQVIYRRGNALRNTGRFEEAVAAYDAALAIKPDYQEALNNKGTALAALKRFEDAIVAYDSALAIDPNKYSCLNNKGMMLQRLGRFEDAIAAYDAALAINPKYSRARQNKAAVLQQLQSKVS